MENKIAIMQPYLFPYIGYFQMINYVDLYILYDDVQWINRGWINRHTVNKNNEEVKLTLSLRKHSAHTLINEVFISEGAIDEYLQQIHNIYKNAPYYNDVYKFVCNIMQCGAEKISELDQYSIVEISKLLGINTKIMSSSNIEYNKETKGQDRIINICKSVGAESYVNNINGRDLYDKEVFLKEKIKLFFFEKEIVPYKQFNDTFVPYLSILDVLMFNDLTVVREMVKKGKVICP